MLYHKNSFLQFVVDSLYNMMYNESTTNQKFTENQQVVQFYN